MNRALLSMSLLIAACAPPADDTGAPWGPRTVETDGGDFLLDLALAPDPPLVGETRLTVVTMDVDGETVSPSLTLTPWMPAHGHGVAEEPVFEAGESGGLEAGFAWSMAGAWELRLGVSAGGIEDTVTVPVEVR